MLTWYPSPECGPGWEQIGDSSDIFSALYIRDHGRGNDMIEVITVYDIGEEEARDVYVSKGYLDLPLTLSEWRRAIELDGAGKKLSRNQLIAAAIAYKGIDERCGYKVMLHTNRHHRDWQERNQVKLANMIRELTHYAA